VHIWWLDGTKRFMTEKNGRRREGTEDVLTRGGTEN